MARYSPAVLDALPLAGAEWEALRRAADAVAAPDAGVGPWTPLAHQVPPLGDWDTWLLLGGRGSGKTAAAARFTHEHVTGPPCLPGLAGGHRVAIIAPTFGDALDACVHGPSGLRSFDPAIRSVQTAGGTFVRWPGGAEAKLFGAYTPEDVERLRAGGNRCLAGSTLVRTPSGAWPISLIRDGDLVLTRSGARRVLHSGMTQLSARLWRLETDIGDIFATADHEVLTARGWLPVRLLSVGDILSTWLASEPSHSSSTRAFDSTRCATATTIPAGAACCIATSGSESAGRFQTALTSTTSSEETNTRSTSTGSTSCQSGTISTSTPERTPGIGMALWPPGPESRMSRWSASGAAAPSRLDGRRAASALTIVASGAIEPPRPSPHTRGDCASCAALSSQPWQVEPRGHAHAVVRRSSPTNRVEPVYDLMVEHDHEFYAGDIVVANCLAYAEELAAWRFLEPCWDHLQFGLRLGAHPRLVAATTPKPRALLKRLLADPTTAVTHATTHDNPHLAPGVRARLEARYGGTALGRQELQGLLIEEVEGALWTPAMLECRRSVPQDLVRVVVAVDPSGGASEDADEQGIIVAGLGSDGRGYVLADRSCRLSPAGWGRRAVAAAQDFAADAIVVERNYGGDMAEAVVLGAARELDVTLRVKMVTASRGKRLRAEPVVALYEQGKVSHVEPFDELEGQMLTWTPESGTSPDRLDALVWALTELLVKEQRAVYVY